MIISKIPFRVVATILARNEEDIIGANTEHHIGQGVEQFIITDNGSLDHTKEILCKYPEVKEIIDEPCLEHRQSEWVTRMARLACKMRPDWIIHLDADELWCGLSNLKMIKEKAVGSTKMLLHPPQHGAFDLKGIRHYLDFEASGLIGECKIAHRPDPEIIVDHGNHGCNLKTEFAKTLWRHHYPIRSCKQFIRKTVDGHEALLRRNAVCERWEKWYTHHHAGKLTELFCQICDTWELMIQHPNTDGLLRLLEFWSTSDVLQFFQKTKTLPKIGEWPRSL